MSLKSRLCSDLSLRPTQHLRHAAVFNAWSEFFQYDSISYLSNLIFSLVNRQKNNVTQFSSVTSFWHFIKITWYLTQLRHHDNIILFINKWYAFVEFLLPCLQPSVYILDFILIAQCTVPSFTSPVESSNCVTESMVNHGTICMYTCATGYTPPGPVSSTCDLGSFSTNPPICEGKDNHYSPSLYALSLHKARKHHETSMCIKLLRRK